jgi:hypothetical protein
MMMTQHKIMPVQLLPPLSHAVAALLSVVALDGDMHQGYAGCRIQGSPGSLLKASDFRDDMNTVKTYACAWGITAQQVPSCRNSRPDALGRYFSST